MPRRTLTGPPANPRRNDGAPSRAPSHTQSNHWKKLLQAPKAPVAVSTAEFVAELNRRLRADACYREGTRFIVASSDDARPGCSTWEGPESMKPVVVRIVQQAVGEYDLELPFFADR